MPFFFFNATPTTEIYTLSLHDALPISRDRPRLRPQGLDVALVARRQSKLDSLRSEEHTSELQSRPHLVCRLLLEKKKRVTNAEAEPWSSTRRRRAQARSMLVKRSPPGW